MTLSSRFLKLNVIFLAFAGMLVFATPFTVAAPASQTLVAPVEFQSSVISIRTGTTNLSFGVIGAPSSGTQDFILNPDTGTVTPQGAEGGSVVTGTSNTGSVFINGTTPLPDDFALLESNLTGATKALCNGGTIGSVTLKSITFSDSVINLTGIERRVDTGGTVEVSPDAEGVFTCMYEVDVSVTTIFIS